MKRSEAIKELIETMGAYDSWADQCDYMLTVLEALGMMPPDNGQGPVMGVQYMSTHLDFSRQPEHKWDAE
jgi:hypothetical protein